MKWNDPHTGDWRWCGLAASFGHGNWPTLGENCMVPPSVPPPPLMEIQQIAGGADWRIRRILCRAGPGAPVAEEQHEWTGVAIVADGTFSYRSDAGAVVLAPGALLLANAGACYECGHAHGQGDTCISFQFAPALVEDAFARFRAHRYARFPVHRVPPIDTTVRATARGIDVEDNDAAQEVALEMLDAAIVATHAVRRECRIDVRDARAVTRLSREVAAAPGDDWTLDGLALRSGMDRFRLIRAFKRTIGTTPYRYVLRQRLEAAARLLLQGAIPVQDVSMAAGFNDLSEFNRRFRSHLGMTPTRFRRQGLLRRPE